MGDDAGLRERFLKIYTNLPLKLRSETIGIVDKEPISWNAAYIEVLNNTQKSRKILKKLDELKIL